MRQGSPGKPQPSGAATRRRQLKAKRLWRGRHDATENVLDSDRVRRGCGPDQNGKLVAGGELGRLHRGCRLHAHDYASEGWGSSRREGVSKQVFGRALRTLLAEFLEVGMHDFRRRRRAVPFAAVVVGVDSATRLQADPGGLAELRIGVGALRAIALLSAVIERSRTLRDDESAALC